jgi:hypothetical protein
VPNVGFGKAIRPGNATGLLTRLPSDAGALELTVVAPETGAGRSRRHASQGGTHRPDGAVGSKIIEQISNIFAPGPG